VSDRVVPVRKTRERGVNPIPFSPISHYCSPPAISPALLGDSMKRILACALLGIGLISPVQAQTVSAGTYDVEGTNLDGSAYEGTATITLASDTTCGIEWTTGSTTSQGICMLHEDAFAAGYVLDDAVGLVVYKVRSDGSLHGTWTITGKDGAGTEILTPQ
jgi:hypothetical protein